MISSLQVVQKTSSETLIVPQRLRNHCISKKDNVARQREKVEKKLVTQFGVKLNRTKCSYGLRTWAFSGDKKNTDVQYDNDVTCKDFH